ncbi:hypothetical protein H0H93_016810, partial [Arthromyces matolae]
FDPLKDGFLRSSEGSSIAIRRPDSFMPSPSPPLVDGADANSHRSRSASILGIVGENEEGDGQTTPTAASPFGPDETTRLLGPPSPSPPPLLAPQVFKVLARVPMMSLRGIPTALWRKTLKSCLLVAK